MGFIMMECGFEGVSFKVFTSDCKYYVFNVADADVILNLNLLFSSLVFFKFHCF